MFCDNIFSPTFIYFASNSCIVCADNSSIKVIDWDDMDCEMNHHERKKELKNFQRKNIYFELKQQK